MTLKLIIAVLNLFHPGAGQYADHFNKYARRYRLPPLLVAAVAYNESRFTRTVVSRTNDYGLMQLHVGRRTHKRYLGREKLLFNPRRNIRLGSRMLAMWRSHHLRRCKGKKHHWLLHYNQGVYVSTKGWKGRYAKRVLIIYSKLKKIQLKLIRKRDATS